MGLERKKEAGLPSKGGREGGSAESESDWEGRADLEDILNLIADEPGKAAWVMEELFNSVLWNNNHRFESGIEAELTPEQRITENQAWKGEMAAFWKHMDDLATRIVRGRNGEDPPRGSASDHS